MDDLAQAVARHYTTGGLLSRIEAALAESGVDPARAAPEDLAPADEFHTGGLAATEALLDQLDLRPEDAVLDIGSGIGGPARLIAERCGCRVTGVDLTPEFVETAEALSRMVGLDDRVAFREGDARALPVEGGAFDLALMMHVGMNVADKPALFREARRALRPGGTFAVFDVMRGPSAEPIRFPLPWAASASTSFVAPPDAYRAAAEAEGFSVVVERDRSDFAREYFAAIFARIEREGPPPLGIHLMMGDTAREKITNYVENLREGRVAPTEMIFRAS